MIKTESVKKQYNDHIKKVKDYEQNRWHKSSIREAGYKMTKMSIEKHILGLDFNSCLELGPGHGTWTHELLKKNPNAKYNLLDISEEMLNLSKQRFADKENVDYIEKDFLKFSTNKKYDLFFSSRAIEYIPGIEDVVNKIVDLIRPGGYGFVITKTPKYLRAKLLGKNISNFHSGQIEPSALKKEFHNKGIKNIKIYPVTMSLPFFKSAKLNLLMYKVFGRHKLNCLSKIFSESYCVKFKK